MPPKPTKLQKRRTWVGLDPGTGGGIATITEAGPVTTIRAWPMPDNPLTIAETFFLIADDTVEHVYLEKVWAFAGQQAKSCFTFGQNFGMLQVMVAHHHLPCTEIVPANWQKLIPNIPKRAKVLKKGKRVPEDKGRWKKKLRDTACKLMPQVLCNGASLWQANQKTQLAVADALLLAWVCWRNNR